MDDGRRFGAATRSPLKQGWVATVPGKAGRRPTQQSDAWRGDRVRAREARARHPWSDMKRQRPGHDGQGYLEVHRD
jgi:hypothetical protein